jgi:DNA modification methylase
MMETDTIHTGDVFDVLPELPADSVHMVMTSPPYWNLRDYGEEEQLGVEDTAEQFVENLAAVFDEVERVLRPDGSLWLNLGDTYDDKDLQQIPARVALALQDRGWILRNRVTWAKPNPMPQSVTDRLNDTTEAIFHFTLSRGYFYDLDAIREPHAESTRDRMGHGYRNTGGGTDKRNREDSPGQNNQGGGMNSPGIGFDEALHEGGKNPGDVFEVTTKPFPEAHFAVYPPELCEKPLKATCPPDGVVLDPFAGAGTTLLKAKELGRSFIGVELNPEYADIARSRVGLLPDDPSHVRGDDAQRGFEAFE